MQHQRRTTLNFKHAHKRPNKSQNPDGLSHFTQTRNQACSHTFTQTCWKFIAPPLKQDYRIYVFVTWKYDPWCAMERMIGWKSAVVLVQMCCLICAQLTRSVVVTTAAVAAAVVQQQQWLLLLSSPSLLSGLVTLSSASYFQWHTHTLQPVSFGFMFRAYIRMHIVYIVWALGKRYDEVLALFELKAYRMRKWINMKK